MDYCKILQSRRAMGGARETEQLCSRGCHCVSPTCEKREGKKKSRLLLRQSALTAPLAGYGLVPRIILGALKTTKIEAIGAHEYLHRY